MKRQKAISTFDPATLPDPVYFEDHDGMIRSASLIESRGRLLECYRVKSYDPLVVEFNPESIESLTSTSVIDHLSIILPRLFWARPRDNQSNPHLHISGEFIAPKSFLIHPNRREVFFNNLNPDIREENINNEELPEARQEDTEEEIG